MTPHNILLLVLIVWLLGRARRGRRGLPAAESHRSAGRPLGTVLELLAICLLVAIVGSLDIAVRVIDRFFPPSPQVRVSAISGDGRSTLSRQMRETKQWIKQAAKSGQQKTSPVLAAKAEKTPPTVAMPGKPADAKNELVAKNDAATKPLPRQPPSPPAPLPRAGEGSPGTAAKPQAGEGPGARATAAAKTRPAWVDAPPQVVGGAYQTSITVGPYTTRGECDAKLPDALQESLNHYVDVYLDENTAGRIRLPNDYLQQRVVKEQWQETRQYSVGPMTQLHVLLSFDRQVKERILEAYRQMLVAGRLWLTGGTLLALLGLLAILYGYLKWSAKSPESSLS